MSAVPEEFSKTFTFQKMDFQPRLVMASEAHQNLEIVPSGVAFKSVNVRTVVSSQQTKFKNDTVEIEGWQYLLVCQ